jgi:hypothetical protein
LSLVVLALHGLVLGPALQTTRPGQPAAATAAAKVRPITWLAQRTGAKSASSGPVADSVDAPTQPPLQAAPATSPTPRPASRPEPRAKDLRDTERSPAGPVASAVAVEAPAPSAPSAQVAGIAPLPVYAVQLPPPLRLRYALRRGDAVSEAELAWQPEPGRYTLSWRGSAINGQLLGRASQGSLQVHGIEPERYAESRRGREQRAVNFQREAGLISFSGAERRVPLLDGAQDRLSWMLQLAGVMAADPALGTPGRSVAMLVAGPRGDADIWQFKVLGVDEAAEESGVAVPTLHLRREAQRPYDTEVDVWLDPQRHHLPVRLLMRGRPDAAATEWRMQAFSPVP